jgi:glutaredoxin
MKKATKTTKSKTAKKSSPVFPTETKEDFSLAFIKNLFPIVLVLGIVILGGFYFYTKSDQGGNSQALLTAQEAADRAITFVNENMLMEGFSASLVDVTEESGLYKIKFQVQDQEVESFVSSDGRFLFVQSIDMNKIEEEKQAEKTDKPDVKLFIMSYCPYGLQAQKALLPVQELLGDKANIEIAFVDYAMHGKEEIDENLRQYCIQKEQKDKYIAYATCFTETDDYEGCLSQASVDVSKMEACVSSTDQAFKITEGYEDESTWLSGRYPQFNVQTNLNEEYGVSGSPTLVINGKSVQPSSRSPEAFKQAICEAFNTLPEECSQALSDAPASPGIGGGTGSSSGGSCE